MTGKRQYESKVPMHIFVLIDALGWQVISGRQFLNTELNFRVPLKTVLGFSSGAIPSILTGLPPARTGRWNLFYYDPAHSPFRWLRHFAFLPEIILDNRYSRKIIKELGRRVLGMGPLFECGVSLRVLPYLNWTEKENIYAPGGIFGSRSIFDLVEQREIKSCVYSYHHLTDAAIFAQAKEDVSSGVASFLFLYLSEFDHFLHGEYSEGAAIEERLAWYDKNLRQLFELAKDCDPRMTFTIISDHGMGPVHSRFDLVHEIESLGFRSPQHYLAVYDSTMARYWFFDDEARRKIVAKLNSIDCGRIIDDAELEQLGIFFPDRRYGQTIFLLNPGWIVAESDFNGRGWNPKGMHGYHPSDPHSDAIFLSNRDPGRQMSTILDIYPCLEEAASEAA